MEHEATTVTIPRAAKGGNAPVCVACDAERWLEQWLREPDPEQASLTAAEAVELERWALGLTNQAAA